LQRLKFFVELNYIGFGKIMKKYERVTGERMRRAFMQRLDQEEFFRSNELGSLIQLTETLFYVVSDGRRLAEVATIMAAPEKAAQTEYIMKPRILILALLVFFVLFFVPLLGEHNLRAHRCIVLMGVVILMWVTEAVPYFVTALLIPVLTVLLGILADSNGNTLSAEDASKEVFSKMFDHTIALVLGGFAISAAFSKFQFEMHLATYIQSKTADRPYLFIFAFMVLGFVLSMFINNVAAPVLCLTVLLPIIRDLPRESPFARCSLLALAFACNIGGMLTPISSPQNTVSLAELSRQDPAHEISFMGWVAVAVPFGCILLVICWGMLIYMMRPNDVIHVPEILHADSDTAFSLNHYVVLIVSAVTVLLWCTFSVTKPFFGDIGVIAMLPLVVFFGTGLLSKQDFNNFSWNLIYLIAGGNVLGDAVNSSGLLKLITDQIAPHLETQSEFVVVIAFCGFVAVVTTFVSHTVAAIIIMPIVVRIGITINHSQVVLFASALMCSGAMALPMTSFPNINSLLAEDDYGRPYLTVSDFLKYGGIFSTVTLIMLITVGYGLIKLYFG
jgi:anion transporter